jgi:hypothetical protein
MKRISKKILEGGNIREWLMSAVQSVPSYTTGFAQEDDTDLSKKVVAQYAIKTDKTKPVTPASRKKMDDALKLVLPNYNPSNTPKNLAALAALKDKNKLNAALAAMADDPDDPNAFKKQPGMI